MARLFAFALFALISCVPAAMACAPGCDNFKWPFSDTLKRLKADDLPVARSGGALDGAQARAFVLALLPEADVDFAVPPERGTGGGETPLYGGTVRFTPAEPGIYQVSLGSEGWIDLVQHGALVASTDHTGSADCPGLRKSVRFRLGATPVTLQISKVAESQIKIAIERVEE